MTFGKSVVSQRCFFRLLNHVFFKIRTSAYLQIILRMSLPEHLIFSGWKIQWVQGKWAYPKANLLKYFQIPDDVRCIFFIPLYYFINSYGTVNLNLFNTSTKYTNKSLASPNTKNKRPFIVTQNRKCKGLIYDTHNKLYIITWRVRTWVRRTASTTYCRQKPIYRGLYFSLS